MVKENDTFTLQYSPGYVFKVIKVFKNGNYDCIVIIEGEKDPENSIRRKFRLPKSFEVIWINQ